MRKLGILLFFLSLGFQINAQNKQWTLKECVVHALSNNISIKQSTLNIDLTDIEKSDAIGNFLPSINAGPTISKNTGLSFNPITNQPETITALNLAGGVSVGYTLFDGLRNFRQVQRAEISKLSSQYRLVKMRDDISLFVANGYLQVLLNKANLDVIEIQNAVTLEQINRVNELVDAGVLPKGDLLEIKATDAREKQSIAIQENAVRISLISLAQLLLIKDYETFDIEDEGFDLVDPGISANPVSEIIATAKENRTEVKIAEKNVELASKDLQIARAGYYPTLSAFFGYDTRYTDLDPTEFINQIYQNDGVNYGLRLSIPVLNGFSVRNNVRRSKINVTSTEYELEQAELDLESNIYQAYVDAKGAGKAYEASLAALESQELAYQYAKDRFDVGLTNSFDFSQSKLRYDNALIEVNRGKYDYIFKIKVLELYFGVPAMELKF
ncbi:MAG: outer membrane protein [Flavobacteriaceae bacterium]|jgi:outer membrane protein